MMTKQTRFAALATAALLLTLIASLYAMGRIPFCECGFGLWTWNPAGNATSQHFGDPYSFTHIEHGLLFFALLWLFARRISIQWRFVIAIALEVAWEILENTPLIINRYRAATFSLDYYGDSILNAVADVLFCALGFYIAMKLPWKWTLTLFVLIELALLGTIRDNLTLNIVMLLAPIDSIKEWQMAG